MLLPGRHRVSSRHVTERSPVDHKNGERSVLLNEVMNSLVRLHRRVWRLVSVLVRHDARKALPVVAELLLRHIVVLVGRAVQHVLDDAEHELRLLALQERQRV